MNFNEMIGIKIEKKTTKLNEKKRMVLFKQTAKMTRGGCIQGRGNGSDERKIE